MSYKSLLPFLLFAIFTFTAAQSPAYANYDENISGDTWEFTLKRTTPRVFPRTFYTIELFNAPNISETQFTMRLAAHGEVSGCADMSDSDVEIEKAHDTLRLKVEDPQIILDSNKKLSKHYKSRYGNHDCEIKRNISSFDIKLDRDILIKKKIKHISLTSKEYGPFGKMDIYVDKYKIDISTKSHSGGEMSTLWFFPKNSVVLHAPNAKIGQDIQDLIRKFGIARGLNPIEDALDKYELPYNANDYVLFTDPSEYIIRQLTSMDENIAIGKITPTRTIYDANGAKEQPYNLDVYATLPGQNK